MDNRNVFFVLGACFLLLLASCVKNSPDDVNFNVTTTATTYSINDTVVFNMTGNPDVITFYSGDSSNNYAFKDRTSKTGGSVNFSFQIRGSNDSIFDALSSGAFKVLFSNNFPSTYSTLSNPLAASSADSAMVNNTSWVDITSRFNIPTDSSVWKINTYFNTPSVNIGDLINNPSNPFNLAFKYASDTTHYCGSNGISIGGLLLNSKFPDGTGNTFNVVPGSSKSTTWFSTKAANPIFGWATSSTQLKFIPKYGSVYTEDWIISNSFSPDAAQPDVAVPIKNISQSALTSFAYKFKQLGLHKVVFIASNNRPSGTKQVVKEIDLTITQ